jgi:hypothetical protein
MYCPTLMVSRKIWSETCSPRTDIGLREHLVDINIALAHFPHNLLRTLLHSLSFYLKQFQNTEKIPYQICEKYSPTGQRQLKLNPVQHIILKLKQNPYTQCCGTVTIFYGSGSGSGSDF